MHAQSTWGDVLMGFLAGPLIMYCFGVLNWGIPNHVAIAWLGIGIFFMLAGFVSLAEKLGRISEESVIIYGRPALNKVQVVAYMLILSVAFSCQLIFDPFTEIVPNVLLIFAIGLFLWFATRIAFFDPDGKLA